MKGYGHAEEMGRKAAQQGRSVQSNPYALSGAMWLNAWLRGYRDEKKKANERKKA